jgi:hypothetical protein
MKKYKWFGLMVLFAIIIGVYFVGKNKNFQIQPVKQITISAPGDTTNQISSPSPSPTPVIQKVINKSTPTASVISGEIRGQIVCDYQVPPAPNQFGIAKIESNWNNANISVCVSANGGSQTLISSDNQINGSRTDNAPWISLNVEYTFTLFSQQLGDPICSGTVLSSCQINVEGPQTPLPGSKRF